MLTAKNMRARNWQPVGLLLVLVSLISAATFVSTWAGGETHDEFQHAIVATNNGEVHEVFFNSSMGIHVTQPALASFAGIIGVAGYFTPNDGIQHVIVATNNGEVHEVFFNSSIGIHVTQPALASFAGIIGVAGYFGGETLEAGPRTWFDAQTGQPAAHPAPYDLVTRVFDPDNGLPLNPMLGSQTGPGAQLASPSLCGGGDPWKRPCTTQHTWIDNNKGKCPSGTLGGHANWGLAQYEGSIRWHGHSYYLQDDDYNINVFRDDLAGVTQVDFDQGVMLHSEFNSDETINYFHSWFWDALHQAVDADSPFHGECNGCPRRPYPKTHALLDNKEVIIMGLYGLDCAHDCGAELHPVYALAVHVKDDLNDDTWAIFLRNWGDEGYCSSGQERIAPDKPFAFSFRFKRPGATDVISIPARPDDPAGQFGTVFFGDSDTGPAGLSISGPSLIPNEAALVTFILPPSAHGGRINGVLHLRWSVATQAASAPGSLQRAVTGELASRGTAAPAVARDIEGEGTDLVAKIAKMTAAQRKALARQLPSTPRRTSAGFRLDVRPTDARSIVGRTPSVVELVPDEKRDRAEQKKDKALRRVLSR